METKEKAYSIVLRQAPIPRIGGGVHYFWVMLDPDGNVLHELHGEAFNRQEQRIATFGDILRGDNQLRFQERHGSSHWGGRALPESRTYLTGSLEEVTARWNAAKELIPFLNGKNIAYHWDEDNSNAAAFTYGGAMGFELRERLPQSTPYRVPGWLIDFTGRFPDAPKSRFRKETPALERKGDAGADGIGSKGQLHGKSGDELNLAVPAKYQMPLDDVAQVTPAMAQQAIKSAMDDDAFGKRYVKGERGIVDYLHALHRAAYPEPEAVVGPRVRPDLAGKASDDWLMPMRDMWPARRALEAAKSDSGFVNRYLDGDRDAFAHMQSLIRAAYPEPDAPGVAATDARSDTSSSSAPWSGDIFSTNAGDAGGDSTFRGGFPDWRDELPRRWRV
jgi:hypothetical protein